MTFKNTRTIKPQQAIEEYLSALLNPSPKVAAKAESKAPVVETRERELSEQEKEALQRTLLTSLRVQPAASPQPEVETVVVKKSAQVSVSVEPPSVPAQSSHLVAAPALEVEVTAEVEAPGGWLGNGRPTWAQNRFECLLFSVAGLKLAVPLVCLGGIHAVEEPDKLTPLPGMPDWFIGILPTAQANLRVVDTARWVMPERQVENYADQMKFVIRIAGSEWGLACDLVDKSFTLEPEDVRWRTSRSKRPWLAGTVIEHMCALMDVDAFNRLLKESEKRNRFRR